MPKRTYDEDDIDCALAAIKTGTSIRQAALQNDVPYSTLRRRSLGNVPETNVSEGNQKLPRSQEQESAVNSFCRQNSSAAHLQDDGIDAIRAEDSTEDVISTWFERLSLPNIKKIKPENRWNVDMMRLFDEESESYCVVGSGKTAKVRSFADMECYTTPVECISATGARCPSLLLATARLIHDESISSHLNNSEQRNMATSNCRMDNIAWLEWLRRIFLPKTKPSRPEETRLLVIAGDNRPQTPKFLQTCTKNNVEVLILPSISSHVLRPLYLTIFPLLKRAFHGELAWLIEMNEDLRVTDDNIFEAYDLALDFLFSERNACRGWSESGLWPVNVKRPLSSIRAAKDGDDDSRGSITSSTASSDTDPTGIDTCSTPKTSADLALLIRRFEEAHEATPSMRLYFREVQRKFDELKQEGAHQKQRALEMQKIADAQQRSKRRRLKQ